MTTSAEHLTQHEADCLADASEGRRIRATADSTRVMSVDADGAVLHHEQDVARLVQAGRLSAEGASFAITPQGRAALSLPVRE